MENFFDKVGSAFTGGFVGGCAICGIFIFNDIFSFAGEYVLKLVYTGAGGLVVGFATASGKYIFDYFKNKRQAKKEKEKEDNESDL